MWFLNVVIMKKVCFEKKEISLRAYLAQPKEEEIREQVQKLLQTGIIKKKNLFPLIINLNFGI